MALVPVQVLRQLTVEKKPVKRSGRWVATMQNACEFLADQVLPKQALRVFLHLLGKLDYDNWILLDQHAIAKRLKTHPSEVSRSVAALVKVGVMEKATLPGGGRAYKLNPLVAYKGTAPNHNRAMEEAVRRWGLDRAK